MRWILKLNRLLILSLVVTFISLSGCSKSTSNIIYTPSEDSVTVSEVKSDCPFEVILDKNATELLKNEKVTIKVVSELEDWEFYAKTENGKINNKTNTSFDYERIKEDVTEDNITIYFTDNKTAKEYEYSIPLIFVKPVNYDDVFPIFR